MQGAVRIVRSPPRDGKRVPKNWFEFGGPDVALERKSFEDDFVDGPRRRRPRRERGSRLKEKHKSRDQDALIHSAMRLSIIPVLRQRNKCHSRLPNSPPNLGGAARSAGVVPPDGLSGYTRQGVPKRFGTGTTPSALRAATPPNLGGECLTRISVVRSTAIHGTFIIKNRTLSL